MQADSISETKLVIILLLAFGLGLLVGLWLSSTSPTDPFPRRYKRRTRPQRPVGNVSPWDKPIPVRRTG